MVFWTSVNIPSPTDELKKPICYTNFTDASNYLKWLHEKSQKPKITYWYVTGSGKIVTEYEYKELNRSSYDSASDF